MRRLTPLVLSLVLALGVTVVRAQPAPLAPSSVPDSVQAAITQYAADQGYPYDGDCEVAIDPGTVCSLVYLQDDGSSLVTFSTINADGTVSAPSDQLSVVPEAPPAALPAPAVTSSAPAAPAFAGPIHVASVSTDTCRAARSASQQP